jgi:cellulose synthase/poly-beta-1,6-N-acetylglucosamine synthase-like glycosyltransferase
MMKISIAVPAYNEGRNIGLLIDSLRAQRTRRAHIVEIVVVASGCSDDTAKVVRERAGRKGTPVRLIEEPVRHGKVAAINTYFEHNHPGVDAVCLCSADLLVTPEVIERLVQCLALNADVGMCGARPMPTNGHNTLHGEATRFIWQMHHRVALEAPKLGELVMFRAGLVRGLPPESAVDEATLEQRVSSAGYRLAYVPEALVHNHGPETLRDFIRQRRRIAAGHYWLRAVSGYSVSTMNVWRTARLALDALSDLHGKPRLYAIGTIGVEVLSRGLGWLDFHLRGRDHAVWKVSETTKTVITDELRAVYETAAEDAPPTDPVGDVTLGTALPPAA